MKKFLALSAIFAFAIASFSQTKAVQFRNKWGKYANDTVLGATDMYAYIQVQRYFKPTSIQPVVAKFSAGTTPSRKFILEGSNDDTTFVSIGTDTLFCSSSISQKIWVLESGVYEYYRIHALANVTAGIPGVDTLTFTGWIVGQSTASNTNRPVNMLSTTYGLYKDTVTNTGTNSLTTKVTRAFEKIGIQIIVTKVSGTAAGTVTLQGSNDGTNYVTINTGYIVNDVTTAPFTTGGAATQTVTNITTSSKLWTLRGSPYLYYRASYTGSGTMVCTLKGWLVGNQ